MNWHLRWQAGRVRVCVAITIFLLATTYIVRPLSPVRAQGRKPQTLGFQGNVNQNTSLLLDGAIIGAHLGSNGQPTDFTSPVRAHAIAVGDFNGDGVPDVVFGAPDQTLTVPQQSGPPVTRSSAGAVYVMFGNAGLLGSPGSPHTIDTNSSTSVMKVLGASDGDMLGFSVAAADVNGDGITDLIIGAPAASFNDTTRKNTGAVYVIFGSSSGPGATIDLANSNAADIKIWGLRTGDQFGASVAGGNVGGLTSSTTTEQAIPDIVVGAPGYAGPNADRENGGGAFVVYGGTTLNRVAGNTTVIDLADPTTPAGVEIDGSASGDLLGTAVAVGDVNASSPGDILVGAPMVTRPTTSGVSGLPNTGGAYVVFGGPNLNPTAGLPRIFDMGAGDQNISIFGNGIGDHAGASVAIGDVTGDNNPDIIIGAPGANGPATGPRIGCGDAFVIPGGAGLNPSAAFPNGRIDLSLAITNPDSTANKVALTVFGATAGDHLGTAVNVGNFNIPNFADNYADLLIGTPGANGGAGEVSVIFGGPTFLASGAVRDVQQDQDDIRVEGTNSAGGALSNPIILRENLATTDTRTTPQLLDVTAKVNNTTFTESTVLQFQSGATGTTGVMAGNVGDGDLELGPNPGLQFSGGSATVPNSASLQPGGGSWTVEFWINNFTAPGSGLAPIAGSTPDYTNKQSLGWGVAVDSSSHVHMIMGDGFNGFDLSSTGTVTNSAVPQHWAAVFNRANTSVSFYLNGNFDSTHAIQAPANGVPTTISQTSPVIIGSDGSSNHLTGLLDDVRVYDAARSSSDVASDFAMELTGSEANLVGYWKFNENQGLSVGDASAHGNNGTLSGSVSFSTNTGRRLPSGSRVSPQITNFTSINPIQSTSLSWNANTPSGTSVSLDASVDGGTTFLHAVNGGPIPGVSVGDALGWAVAAVDINGDAAGDLIMGAPGANAIVSGDSRTQAGVIYAIAGTAAAPPPPPPSENHPPTVTVTAPTGGENLLVQHQFNIAWDAHDPDGDSTIKSFEIDLSLDSGATFAVIATALDPTSRSFNWTVPIGVTTTHGRIRVTATDDHGATGFGVSPSDFTISDNGISVNLVAPQGGETYLFGQVVPISWTVGAADQGFVGGFDLLLSTDGGVTFPIKIANGADPTKPALDPTATSFNWTVPGICTTNARISVVATSISGLRTSSTQPTVFTIEDVGPIVSTKGMTFPRDTGQMTLLAGTSPTGAQVLFSPDVTLEVSSDEAGTQFFQFSNVKVKKNGHKLIGKGTINNMKPAKFFPAGDTRVLRITNPTCGITLLKVMHQKDKLVAVQ